MNERPMVMGQIQKGERSLDGHIALITGASRGIGAATATLLASSGAAVCINYHGNVEAARAVVHAIESQGGKALAVQADVTDASQVSSMIQQVNEKLGPVDTVVLSSLGGSTTREGIAVPFPELQWEQFEEIVNAQLKAAFTVCKAVIPMMQKNKRGCVIAVSSIEARRPIPQFFALSSAKAGLDAMMRNLALQYGPDGIRFNSVAPALVETDANKDMPEEFKGTEVALRMTPLRRIAHPEDIAGAILLLASPQASFVTGTFLPVDGGWSTP